MDRNSIKEAILAKMDEISPFETIDVIWDSLMEQVIDEACNNYLMLVPIHLVNSNSITTSTFVNNDDGTGYIRLPLDFLRLSGFKMKGWRRQVSIPITQESPRYNLQLNKYTRAGIAKPMVALVNKLQATQTYLSTVLELFPIYYDWQYSDIETALYIKKTLPENLQDNLLTGYLWYATSQLLLSMERPDFAKVATSKFEEYVKSNSSRG